MEEGDLFFLKDDHGIASFMKRLNNLIQIYKFELETISILSNIELNKLKLFFEGKEYLTYDEVIIIETVICDPFESAIDIAKENYRMVKKTQEIEKNILQDFNKENEIW